MFTAAELADNCASVLLGAFGKFDEWHADLHDISLGAKQCAMRPFNGDGISTTALSVSTETSG
jgi:hypothetical protein